MTTAQESIRRLIDDDMYVPDAREIAAAILVRAVAHATVARTAFHSDQPPRRGLPGLRARRRRRGSAH